MSQIQNLSQLNHFEKFSFSASFEIDLEKLEEKYLNFQKQFHPDSNQNQEILNSIAINEAYEILKNPLKRAIYLLKINGIDINDDNCHIKPNQQTLIAVMEIKEELANINNSDIEEINKIKNSLKEQIKKLMQKTKDEFLNKNYKLAAEKLIEVKYFNKILSDLKRINN